MTGSLQIKNGKYYMVLNFHENGKRKLKWVATNLEVKGNKRRAEQMLRERLAEEEQRTPGNKQASEICFADYVRRWLVLSERRVDAVTLQGYETLVNRHILPWLDQSKLTLAQINRQMLQDYLDEKGRSGRLDGKGGLSSKSVRELKNVLNQVLNEAVREDYLTANPCALLRLPPKERSKAQFYTAEQLKTLLAAARDEALYPLILTAVYYGLRRSELLGLRWECFDFENNTFTIQHTVVKVRTTVAKDKTKNASSHRSFPLLPEMREMFLALREEQQENRRLLQKEYTDTGYVFCWTDGRPFTSDYVSHRFGKILKKHNLPHIRFHDLRHSCASLLINQGMNLKDVQEWMGHSDIATTADIYGHLETQRKQKMAQQISGCIKVF